MSFVNYLKRQAEGDDPFVALESDMSDALEQEFAAEAIPTKPATNSAFNLDETVPGLATEEQKPVEPATKSAPVGGQERLTSNSKKFLAGFDLFEARFMESQAELKELGEKVASLSVTQHLTRDFLNLMQSSIYNANELELNNKDLHAKNRALTSQLESARSLNIQQKSSFEELRGREAALQQEREVIRSSLATANDELGELRKEATSSDAELAELRRELTTKITLSEKLTRENEIIREKHINLSVDLDSALKSSSEVRRKYDEVSTNFKSTTAELTEAMSQLSDARTEAARLGREVSGQSAKLTESAEALRTAEFESEETINRIQTEIQTVKNENQSLDTRFQAASREQASATEEMIAIKLKLNDAVSERRVAEEKLGALAKEFEDVRREHGETSTRLSELNLERASEHVVVETAQQQLEEQRSEIERLKSDVKRLIPFERLYRRKKEELTCSTDVETAKDTPAVTKSNTDATAETNTAEESSEPKSKPVAAVAKKSKSSAKSGKAV